MDSVLTTSPVLIIGTGLLGTSIALHLRRNGVVVHLQDASPVAAGLARDLGAGTLDPVTDPTIVVVAVPPDVTSAVVSAALDTYPGAVVTDVASVKATIEAELAHHPQRHRYVGSHPMAGRERAGAIAADADLFIGRPWVIVRGPDTDPGAVATVRTLAVDLGAAPAMMNASEHDHAVAVVSHVPQLMSSLVAATLVSEHSSALDLAGQGLRDVTRIAESDALLWTSIINGNRAEIASVLRKINARLGRLVAGLDSPTGHLDVISSVIADGNKGVRRIPGKHGGAPAQYAEVTVLVPDEPGELGRLFTEIGDIGVNIEDLVIEHSAAQPVGRAIVSINPSQTAELEEGLENRGWQVVQAAGRKPTVPITIAIDGPSGSGKSTVSKRVAADLGLAYLDTGAMYRAATWWALHENIDLDDADAVLAATVTMPLQIELDPNNQRFICGGEDITQAIRASELSKVVSKVAVNIPVRHEMARRQQSIIAEQTQPDSYSHGRGIVAEGRDITTVVAPDADVRVLLTASEEARLARRALEVRGSASDEAMEQTRDEVLRRDRDDSTVSEFMTAQDGVTTIDSSALNIDQVVEAVKSLIPEDKR
ncbi:MAG: prephenate dehydrogenase [Arcanobacterium sp.]